jgi:threonine synthase
MGLPIRQFIVSTNINDVIPEYLRTRSFEPRASKQTISNAMDVGNPSNFVRMIDLYDHDFEALKKDVTGYAFTDKETRQAMQNVYAAKQYVLDPHGAVGYLGLKKYLSENGDATGIFLETAHPGKFLEVVEQALDRKIALPPALEKFMSGEKHTIRVTNRFEDFKKILRRL